MQKALPSGFWAPQFAHVTGIYVPSGVTAPAAGALASRASFT